MPSPFRDPWCSRSARMRLMRIWLRRSRCSTMHTAVCGALEGGNRRGGERVKKVAMYGYTTRRGRERPPGEQQTYHIVPYHRNDGRLAPCWERGGGKALLAATLPFCLCMPPLCLILPFSSVHALVILTPRAPPPLLSSSPPGAQASAADRGVHSSEGPKQ